MNRVIKFKAKGLDDYSTGNSRKYYIKEVEID